MDLGPKDAEAEVEIMTEVEVAEPAAPDKAQEDPAIGCALVVIIIILPTATNVTDVELRNHMAPVATTV